MEPSNSEYGIILKRARYLIWEHLGDPLEAGRRVHDAFCRLSGSSPNKLSELFPNVDMEVLKVLTYRGDQAREAVLKQD